MTGLLITLGIALIALLWLATSLRRRALRRYLLATGAQTVGSARLVTKPRTRYPSIQVDWQDRDGGSHTSIKVPVGAGDAELVKRKAMVVYHPKRASREEYVLLGFGAAPTTWFRARTTSR